MLALKFTQKLIKDMKVSTLQDVSEANPLFSWHVNILQLRRKHIIFVNDLTRMCIVLDGVRSNQLSKLQEKFIIELKQYLLLEGFKRSYIEQYLLEAGAMTIGKTNDRSVIGTITEMSFLSGGVEFQHPYDLSAWLNNMIYKPVHYSKPIELFKDVLGNRYA